MGWRLRICGWFECEVACKWLWALQCLTTLLKAEVLQVGNHLRSQLRTTQNY